MKKLLCLIIAVTVISCLAMGASAQMVIYEEFSGTDTGFSGHGLKLSGGTAEITEISDSGKTTGALIIADTNPGEATALQINLPKSEGTVAAEIKFKLQKDMNSMYVSAGKGNTTLSSVQISSAGMVSVSDGGKSRIFQETTARLNTWITIRFCYYPSTGKVDVRCNSEIIKGLSTGEDYSGEGIDFILIQSGSGVSDIVVDYYLSEQGTGLDADVRPIEPEYIDAPVSHARKDKINIKYNGTYIFFDYEPVIENDRVLLPFRRTFEMLGLSVGYNPDERTATGKNENIDIKITEGSNVAYVNGEKKLLDVIPCIIDDSFYIPVRFVAQSVNKQVEWDNNERTVIIED